jgi:O-antigen ligase
LDRWGTTGSELAGGSLNERIYIWKAGLNAFFQAPLWGIGAGAFSAAVEPFFGQGKSPHNVYLAILVEQGLVGFAPFALILFTALYSVMKMPKSERNFWLVLLATWGISAFVLNWEWRKQTWLLLGFVAAHVELLRKQPKNESSNIKMKMIYKPWRF